MFASSSELRERMNGVSAVLVSPFRDGTGSVDASKLADLVRHCDDHGAHVVTLLGNTAEVYQLSGDERVASLRAGAAARRGTALLAGVVGPFTDAVQLGREAADLGFDAVMVHEPLDPLAGDDGIVSYIERVVEAIDIPAVLYLRTGRLSRESVRRLAGNAAIVAVKWALSDPAALADLLWTDGLADECVWVCGLAEAFVPAFAALGVRGFTSGLANVRPDLSLRLWEEASKPTADGATYAAVLPFEQMRRESGGAYNVAVVKHALRARGVDAGSVRAPCLPLDDERAQRLDRILASWDGSPS